MQYICEVKCTAWNSGPVCHEVVSNNLNEQNLNKLWDLEDTDKTPEYENVSVCRPEVTQHVDIVNLSKPE